METGLESSLKKDAYQYSGLALAYLGDSALDLYVKEYFVRNVDMQPHKYHKEVTQIVKAVNQARFADEIGGLLTETESDIYRRGRNAQPHTKAKSATRAEYSKATGLEALFGYLYLTKQSERFAELADMMIQEYLSTDNRQ